MKKIIQLIILISIINMTTNCQTFLGNILILMIKYQDWKDQKNLKHDIINPATKFINEAAKEEELLIDLKIKKLSINTNNSKQKENLQKIKNDLNDLVKNPNALFEIFQSNPDFPSAHEHIELIRENFLKDEEKRRQINLFCEKIKNYPNLNYHMQVAMDTFKKKELIKKAISSMLTSAEEYDQLISQGE